MAEYSKERTRQFNQNVYITAFCILVVKAFIMDTSSLINPPDFFDLILTGGFLLCMCYKMMTQHYTSVQVILFGILGILCVYTCPRVDNYYLVFSFFGVAAIQDVDLKEVLKRTSALKAGIIAFHVAVYFPMLLLSPSSITYSYREDGAPRHFFFLGHANTFAGYVLWTSLEFIYANYDGLKKKHLLMIWGVNLFAFIFADSNTSFATATVMILLFLFDKMNLHIFDWLVSLCARYLFAAFTIVFAASCVVYTRLTGQIKELYILANKFFTGRLLYGAYVYDTHGFTLFGRSISFASKTQWREYWFDTMVFDNAYIWMFVLGGAFYLAIISVAIFAIGKKTTRVEQIVLIAYAIYGVNEAYIINAQNCFPLLLVGVYLYREKVASKKQAVSFKAKFYPESVKKGQRAYEKIKHHYSGI